MNAITPFEFDQNQVRVVDQDGQPWFVVSDVCAAIGLSNPTMAAKALDDDERAKLNLGRQGEATVINEGGLYTLILRCRDAMTPGTEPYRFRKWVTSNVLPAIRRAGQFAPAPLALDDPATLRAALLGYTEKVIALEAAKVELEHRVEQDAPKVAFAERIAALPGSVSVASAAQTLGTGQNRLFAFMRSIGWLQKSNAPYQHKIDDGCLENKPSPYLHPRDGSLQHSYTTLVTAKGLVRLQRAWSGRQAERASAAA